MNDDISFYFALLIFYNYEWNLFSELYWLLSVSGLPKVIVTQNESFIACI